MLGLQFVAGDSGGGCHPDFSSASKIDVKITQTGSRAGDTRHGILKSVTDYTTGSAGTVYWQANTQNARGQITQEALGNGVITNRAFDAVTGQVSAIQSGLSGGAALQNESYLYDLVGNVTQRQNSNAGLTENFYYDNLYRLSYSQLNGSTNLDLIRGSHRVSTATAM